MVSENYKKRVQSLVETAKKKGRVKSYDEFCKTDLAQKTKLTKKEIDYYTSKKKGG